MKQVITDLQDYRYLTWDKTRHSSGTAGSFLKAYEKSRGKKIYYKLSNFDSMNGIVGHECINEIVVDRLLTAMGIEHLSYQLINAEVVINGNIYYTYLCKSYDFKKTGDKKVSIEILYKLEALKGETPLEFCIRKGWGDYIYKMLVLDYIILNRDRHGANIEIVKNATTKQSYPAPLFDHGLSLMFNVQLDHIGEYHNYLDDKPVQCFVGGNSTLNNLNLIPVEKMIKLPSFDEKLKTYIFEDIQEITGNAWCEQIWSFIKERAESYESIRNKRQSE